jgi:hypothetical protein
VTAPGRILVLLHEPGYFRLYGTAIVELARRGWEVLLAFDKPDRRGDAPLVPHGAGPRVQSVGAVPAVGRGGLLAALRAGLDYVRYLEPRYAHSPFLRGRAEKRLPPSLGFLGRVGRAPRWVVSAAIAAVRLIETLVPADPRMRRFVREQAPDVVFVSPLVTLGPSGGGQTEAVKAARALGVPTVVGVASWDHLTSKGLLRVVPDALMLWNEAQRNEAVELHRIPPARVQVTGAQSLDHWFDPASPEAVARFRTERGVPDGTPVILYVGSSKNMAPGDSEPAFVERWLAGLEESPAGARAPFVIVRPHPANVEPWQSPGLELRLRQRRAVVWPSAYSGMPLRGDEIEAFRLSLLASTAVVGVNTTAMIEAAIVGRPVLTVHDPAFVHSQRETLHFAHLADGSGGCALVASTLDEHLAQLEAVLADPDGRRQALSRFVSAFVRPRGLDRRATDWLCDAIERVAGARRAAPAREIGDVQLAGTRRRP